MIHRPHGTTGQTYRSALRLEAPCDFNGIRDCTRIIRSFLSEKGLLDSELDAWELALAEAGNNAVEHTTPEARHLAVGLDISCGESDVEIRVTDHTPGFDWPSKVSLPDIEDEGGRGLFLIQSLTDRSTYLRGRGENCLILSKQRVPADPFPPPTLESLKRQVNETETALGEMTEELSFCYESLTTIFRYSAGFGSSRDVLEFARGLLSDLAQITQADAVILRVAEAERGKLPAAMVFPETLTVNVTPLDLDSAVSFLELDAIRTRHDTWFDPDAPLANTDPLVPIGMALGICHPCNTSDHFVGSLTLCRTTPDKPFASAQISLLHTFSDFLAIQIVNTRLLEERLQTNVTRRELEIASDIQRSLLPSKVPDCPPFTLVASCESAREVGGDIYDVIQSDHPGLFVIVADVMGKGVPAALFASVLRSAVRSMPHLYHQPSRLLAAINNVLYEDFSRVDMFATAQAAYIDPASESVLVASAGHCPMLVWTPGMASAAPTGDAGLPLGIEADAKFEDTSVVLAPRACVLLYTDGLTEARNSESQFLGQERLVKWFTKTASSLDTAAAIQARLLDKVAGFRAGTPMSDDQTTVLIRHLP